MTDDDFQAQLNMEEAVRQQEAAGSSQQDPYTYVDPSDGTVYGWNLQQQAWFPKVNDDFIAAYQANYQYQGSEMEESREPTKEEEVPQAMQDESKAMKRKANDPCWFDVDDDRNTNVYVSDLPLNTTEEEFVELMSKCGLVMKDPDNMKFKIKLYRNVDGTLKGDGLCCYIKIESVNLALDLLDGSYFKNKIIHVEKAQFELKGSYDPSRKPKKRKAKDKEKLKKRMEKLFDWRPDKLRGERSRNEKTVIIKNMFDPKEFDVDASLIIEYQRDVREECSKCGEVKKVVVFDHNPEGVISVTFAEAEMADECIKLMNGRWFAARQLTAETWDGKTKYKVNETEEERDRRLKEWEEFLDGSNKMEPRKPKTSQRSKETDDYEMADATDDSGDSDVETDPLSRPIGALMNANGKLTFMKPKGSGSRLLANNLQ